jgi:Alginate export
MRSNYLRISVAAALLAASVASHAEDEAKTTVPGLPAGTDWKLEFSAGWGFFGFGNSLFANSHDEVTQDLSDNWMEGFVKGGFSGTHKLSDDSEFYGALTGVGERTYNAPPPLVGGEASSFDVEDMYLGWRNETFDVVVGRTQYKLGHGLLIYDGGSEGGSRGGFWSGARKTFEFAAIAKAKFGGVTVEGFYLDRDELPESDSGSATYGANFEYAWNEDNTLGATYTTWTANELRPERDGMDAFNLRAYLTPFSSLKALSFELEYAVEDNGELIDSTAWNALVGWQFEGSWAPKLTYRYAIFEGDDPGTVANESFDGLWTGFYDWGSWWQGEIGGEYFLSNSNLISQQLRIHAKPSESIGTGLILYDFKFDIPESAGVVSDDIATELDWYLDWTLNDHFTVSFVAAYATPGEGVEEGFGRDEDFYYGMVYVAYSY